MEEVTNDIAPITNNATSYKNVAANVRPSIDHKHLEFIESFDGERIVYGAFNLNGRYWGGSIWVYDDSSNFERSHAVASWITEAVVCDSVFIDRDKFVVAEESGVLQVLEVAKADANTQAKDIRCLGLTCQHDNSILSVSAFHSKNRVVTGGMDCCIKVWNLADLLAEYSYEGAHRKCVTCVDTKPKSNDVFASSSYDGEIAIWDVRQKYPANVTFARSDAKFLAAAWHPDDENLLAIGSIDGSLKLLDVRKPKTFVAHSNVFDRPVRKIKYDQKRPYLLAACCDNTTVKVLDTTRDFSVVYEDDRHDDLVRDVSWCNEELLTCSWDNTVLRHKISEVPVHDK